jgi:glycosyltransferase involved in cell wall biosynthesis
MMQCQGLASTGAKVRLYAKRTVADPLEFRTALQSHYGVSANAFEVASYFSVGARAQTLRIAALALRHMLRGEAADIVISRNLYASFALAVLCRQRMVFETHQLEYGFRRWMQRLIMTSRRVSTVVISKRLDSALRVHHGAAPFRTVVLHDAAPDDIKCISPEHRRIQLAELAPLPGGAWQKVCGYFGHLYAGRGVEIIAGMAAARPNTLFLVFGGTDADIARCRAAWQLGNLKFMGHLPHQRARQVMSCVDMLLMPYQTSVSIGVPGHDTSDWMSPMKMFEYMATSVPVISSDLPALREVLVNGVNCLLAAPASLPQWLEALDRLTADEALAAALGARARAECVAEFNWTRRAHSLIQAMPSQ